jgi:competence protein ComEC
MPTIHYLNVLDGDCSAIKHYSGHVTIIDVCNARKENALLEKVMASRAAEEKGLTGNFNQKR